MKLSPEINFVVSPVRYMEPLEFTADSIRKLFDANGRLIGICETRVMTREELEKLYGPVEKTDISTAF